MRRFRRKPVVVEAVHYTGFNLSEIEAFADTFVEVRANSHGLFIKTLEGVMRATPGDWIIKGVMGEFYPCKPDIFFMTYETVD